jgi:hypothetical protein
MGVGNPRLPLIQGGEAPRRRSLAHPAGCREWSEPVGCVGKASIHMGIRHAFTGRAGVISKEAERNRLGGFQRPPGVRSDSCRLESVGPDRPLFQHPEDN